MKKVFIFLLTCLILQACQSKEKKDDFSDYSLAMLDSFEHDDSLLTGQKLIRYPNNVSKSRVYSKKELNNLDYNKEVYFADLYFRLPEKAEIFKKDKRFYSELPTSLDFDLLLSFEDISKDLETDLIDECWKIIKENNLEEKLISKPILNKLSFLDSAYFISKDEDIKFTHFLLKGDSGMIYFILRENTKLSNSSAYIMADLLMTAYQPGDDPFEIRKSFTDYKESLNIYASKQVKLGDISLKLPENFYLNQESDGFSSFIAKDGINVIAEVMIKKDLADKNNIYKIYSENSGDVIYPTQIVNIGEVSNNGDILEGKVRVYMQESTLTGKKYCIKVANNYYTIIVVGPLANESLSNKMADIISETIKY